MTREVQKNKGFILTIAFQASISIVAALLIVFGNIELALGGLALPIALIAGIIAGIIMYSTIFFTFRLKFLSRLKEDLNKDKRKLSFSWPQIVTISIFAGISEELLFRGLIQGWLAGHINIFIAILVTSLIFGLGHFASFTNFLLTTVISIVLGVAYHVSQSIEFVIVWHITADIIALGVAEKYPELWREKPITSNQNAEGL